ncbi:MAG: fibronectin/fibrinogen-binding protein [Ruminococcaceae bacterium]|nr:fibronectin/fibrinogen-binding protein [Oscillospiraceae bacterium]
MPYDGIVASGVVWELSGLLSGGRIEKIYQTEQDEIILLCHSMREKYRLLLSASPANPRIHLTKQKKENPAFAPPFCMVLRKHIQGGKISEITQEGFDRVISIKIDTYNEMGDPIEKKLIIEIMGRHSNIMLVSPGGVIYDAIKHIDSSMSSLREVLPAHPYVLPPQQDKISPNDKRLILEFTTRDIPEDFKGSMSSYLLESISGFSPLLCKTICNKAGVSPQNPARLLSQEEKKLVFNELINVCDHIAGHMYRPAVIIDDPTAGNYEAVDFHCLDTVFDNFKVKNFSSINLMLDEFYTQKDIVERSRQKKSSIKKQLSNAVSRAEKKLQIYDSALRESENFDNLRIKGELITANMYILKGGESSIDVVNYYSDSGEILSIELDKNKSAAANAQIYYKKYKKKKSTYENALQSLKKCSEELAYLKSVEEHLESCVESADIAEIKEELSEQGYYGLRQENNRKSSKKNTTKIAEGSPISTFTTDGYEILIGKNNKQNDTLTLRTSNPNDLWFHVKDAPGSHVILRISQKDCIITNKAVTEAAIEAARHSSLKSSSKVEVDYTRVKYVKKPSGAKPGRVIYTNQKTIIVSPNT